LKNVTHAIVNLVTIGPCPTVPHHQRYIDDIDTNINVPLHILTIIIHTLLISSPSILLWNLQIKTVTQEILQPAQTSAARSLHIKIGSNRNPNQHPTPNFQLGRRE
jgi:hypothetical protein